MTSGGPGGQHANRSQTRIEVSFDVEASATLTAEQREVLRERFGRTVTAASGDERSQRRNRRLAFDRLAARIAAALEVPAARRRTRPTRASIDRRLADKRRAAARRSDRAVPDDT